MAVTQLSQKEYLKRYLSAPDEKKKKRKKKIVKGPHERFRVVDDDIDLKNMRPIDESELDLYNLAEDAPQIAGIIDERPEELRTLEEFRESKKWKIMSDESGLNDIKVTAIATKDKQTNSQENKMVSKQLDSNSSHSKTHHSDSDTSPPRKTRRHSDSDNSPPRKSQGEIDDDQSPPRRHKKSNSHSSPVRKSKVHKDSSPVRSKKHESDLSPIRKSRHDVSSSPSRKAKYESDKLHSTRNKHSGDLSPPRKSKLQNDSDSSPPRKSRLQNDSDSSPPRKSRLQNNSDSSPPRKRRRSVDSDISPPRNIKKQGKSSRRHETDSDSDLPVSRKRHSPEGRTRKEDSRTRRASKSPPRRNRSRSPFGKGRNRNSPPRKDPGRSDPESRTKGKMERTLDGKRAGLQNARDLREEISSFRKKEDNLFSQMTDDVSGRGAAAIMRDRKTGKRRNLEEEAKQREVEEQKLSVHKEKYSRWGKGLKQVEEQKENLQQALHEMSKPLARYADDNDLEQHLRNQDREGDPMLDYIRSKRTDDSTKSKPKYQGSFLPNRFGIPPGHRWDGVDRSNGYEKQWFEHQNSKRAVEEEAYKWSTSDM